MLHKIKELCKQNGITITRLEQMADIGSRTITRWDVQDPSVHKVYRVAKILNTTVEELIEG